MNIELVLITCHLLHFSTTNLRRIEETRCWSIIPLNEPKIVSSEWLIISAVKQSLFAEEELLIYEHNKMMRNGYCETRKLW